MPESNQPGKYVEEIPSGPRSITGAPTGVAAFVGRTRRGPAGQPRAIRSWAEYEEIFGGLWQESPLSYAARQFFLNGGTEAVILRLFHPGSPCSEPGLPLTAADFQSDDTAAPPRRGLAALEEASFDLLVIPPFTPQADVDPQTLSDALDLCARRRAMLIVDAPASWDSAAAAASAARSYPLFSHPGAGNAAIYFPRVLLPDPLDGDRQAAFPPSGMVASIFARMDAIQGVWKAPAGNAAVLNGAQGLSIALTTTENNELNSLGVNCLRAFPGAGTVIWGARTMSGADGQASDWKYVSVRRLFLFIERSIDQGLQWAAFEPNDETLWVRVRALVGSFLMDLFQQGAMAGNKPDEAYFVKCDRGTMTQDDIDNGRLILLIGVAPVKPAEFVIIRIQMLTCQAGCP